MCLSGLDSKQAKKVQQPDKVQWDLMVAAGVCRASVASRSEEVTIGSTHAANNVVHGVPVWPSS